jgi:hypothetical protein
MASARLDAAVVGNHCGPTDKPAAVPLDPPIDGACRASRIHDEQNIWRSGDEEGATVGQLLESM